jgi:transcriptional regulator with XRE-family HTH domain
MSSKLITLLTQVQLREGLNDVQMSKRLGCSRQLYQMTRTGKVPPGVKILKGAASAYPELKDDVIYFLLGNAAKTTLRVDKDNPIFANKNGQERGIKHLCGELVARIYNAAGKAIFRGVKNGT